VSVGYIPLEQIHGHPSNPRRDAVANDDMIASVRALGVLTAVTLAPALDGDGYILIGGHRRLNAAKAAGLTQVPAVIREDLVTEAQQVEAMIVENVHRSDLTMVEEAAAYEQLTLFGLDVDAIADATGRSAATVKARLKLNTLPPAAREHLHAGDMTLGDAEALLEFSDDPAALAELEASIGSPRFRTDVQVARGRRERAAANAATIAGWVALGGVELTSVPGLPGAATRVDTGEEITGVKGMHVMPPGLHEPKDHDGCLGYFIPRADDYWGLPRAACIDSSRHPELSAVAAASKPVESIESDWEKRRAEREAAQEREEAASKVRLAWLVEHFTGLFPTKSHQDLATAARAFLPIIVVEAIEREVPDVDLLLTALGCTVDRSTSDPYGQAVDEYAAGLGKAKPTTVLAGLAGYLAAHVAEILAANTDWIDQPAVLVHHLTLWDWLRSAGYPMTDVDIELRARLESKLLDLTRDEGAEAS
jgi:ParB/RepB/Spo0J family partition protein